MDLDQFLYLLLGFLGLSVFLGSLVGTLSAKLITRRCCRPASQTMLPIFDLPTADRPTKWADYPLDV